MISTRNSPASRATKSLTEALQSLKPDAVAVCAYTEHHAPMALEALAAGAHVFCEKPLADTLEAAERVVAAARAANKVNTRRAKMQNNVLLFASDRAAHRSSAWTWK